MRLPGQGTTRGAGGGSWARAGCSADTVVFRTNTCRAETMKAGGYWRGAAAMLRMAFCHKHHYDLSQRLGMALGGISFRL